MTLRMRVLPRFPATITATNGLIVERPTGTPNLIVKPDFGPLVQIPSVGNGDEVFFMAWDRENALYRKISFNDLFEGISDLGFMTVPVYDPQGIEDDAFDRANHTGTQAQSTIVNLVSDLAAIVTSIGTKVDKATAGFGQCRLALSGGNLVLSRFNGQWLMINGAMQSVPSGGVSLAATGLTPGTLYYIYAFMNSGTMTLEASTTTHATDATYGLETKSGDATRTLVGMARPITGPAWADSGTQRFVRSWFNRRPASMRNAFTASRSTTSTSTTEINTEIRCEWVQWADDVPSANIQGSSANNTANVTTLTSIGWDGTPDANTFNGNASATGLFVNCSTGSSKEGLSEGYHYATLVGSVASASTGSWAAGTGVGGTFTSLSVRI